ncbi:PHD-finger family protein [Oxytricha trifallax]|uniref:PHD-finger family protein n=1 Tax=Oxytricha trifallax TaxID=1172189 RepID=A0A073I0A2_9SPIT|nr:PHD-finger family protein [Oxytricha trifallax]
MVKPENKTKTILGKKSQDTKKDSQEPVSQPTKKDSQDPIVEPTQKKRVEKQLTKEERREKKFKKFQYQEQIFQVGDVCRFFNENGDLIGKIMEVLSTDPKDQDFGKLRVQWYYYKKDLNQKQIKLSNKQFDAISDVEIFPTNHFDKTFVQTINAKCTVKTLEEYEQLEQVGEDTYFTRASYDLNKKTFKPEFKEWETSCSCKLPTNPLQQYVQCEACQEWFHPACEKTTVDDENFLCSKCKETE